MTATFSDLEIPPSPCPPLPLACLRPSLAIPMRDGTMLRGDLYLPEGRGPWPIIVERTPYGAAALGPLGECYAAHEYLYLAVDVRGRYRSEGAWDPLAHEKTDGPDVLHWAAALAECDGRVGTRGHSYAGVNQLLAAPHAGECLRAMVAYVSPGDPFDNVPFQGGAYDLSDYEWAWFQTGPYCQSDETSPDWDDRFRKAFAARPLVDADLRLGLHNGFIREWMRHWRLDGFWEARCWRQELRGLTIPTLHISGWWDNNGRGAALAYEALGGRAGGQRLLLGPWEHTLVAPELDDLPPHEQALVKRAALRDAFTDELEWFEAHLKGQKSKLAAAEIFVTGAWRWIETDDWPPPGTQIEHWHLATDGGLERSPPAPGERRYAFDPGNPNTASVGECPVNLSPYDTRSDVRDDVLVYRSRPLAEGLLALGDARLEMEAASTARDVDWEVRLVDEYPDGRAIWVRDGILRSRFRDGYESPRLLVPGERANFSIDLWHVGHLFRAGHRLRVEVCSSLFGRWDVNLGDGGDPSIAMSPVRSVQTVFHGRGSRLILPVCPLAAGGASMETLGDLT